MASGPQRGLGAGTLSRALGTWSALSRHGAGSALGVVRPPQAGWRMSWRPGGLSWGRRLDKSREGRAECGAQSFGQVTR